MTAKTDAVTAEQATQITPFIALVALDDGSGNVAASFRDMEGELYEEYQPSLIETGEAASLGDSAIVGSIWTTEEGNTYTVRKNPRNPLTTLDPDYQLSEANRVLGIDTMVKAGLGGALCAVGCTLPVEQFFNRNDRNNRLNQARIQAKKANLMKGCVNRYGAHKAPQILAARVYPEAYPAYYYCASPDRLDGAKHYPDEHTTLVVDLGEFTADLAIIGTGNDFGNFSTHEHGIHVMVAHFRSLLARNSGIRDVQSMSDAAIKKIIERGYVGSHFETPEAIAARIDVTDLVRESANHLDQLLQADIREVTRGEPLDRIVFVGGGANWLREQAAAWHHSVDIPAQPELAIMRGVQLLLESEADAIREEAIAAQANRTAA